MTKKEVLSFSNSELDRVVKIQGTKFDRKRKVSASMVEKINYLRACGKTYAAIARELNISDNTAKYYCDDYYRWMRCHRGGTHAKSSTYTPAERSEYKRKLVNVNAHVIYPKN